MDLPDKNSDFRKKLDQTSEFFRTTRRGKGSCFRDAIESAGIMLGEDIPEFVNFHEVIEICTRQGWKLFDETNSDKFKINPRGNYITSRLVAELEDGVMFCHAEYVKGWELEAIGGSVTYAFIVELPKKIRKR